MRIRHLLCLGLLSLMTACAPAGGQPVFSARELPSATAIPAGPAGRVPIAFAQRIAAFDVRADGRQIAIATSGDLRIYDLRTYQLVRRLQGGEMVGSAAWSADGTRLAVGSTKDYGKPFFTGGDASNSWKAVLRVYDTSTWKVLFQPDFGNEMVNMGFQDMAWSPNGRLLAFSMDIGGVQVLDTQNGGTVSRQSEFAATVGGLAWSPDGSRLVATHDLAYGLRRWRVSDDAAVRLFDQRAGASLAVAWSPDGQRIASGHVGGGVCLWTAGTNRCDGFIHAHRSATFSLAWSPDGTKLATGGGVIRIWDAHSGQLLSSFGEVAGVIYSQMEWPAQGGQLVTLETGFENPGETAVKIWDLRNGAIVAEFPGYQRVQ